ncbi:CRISPR system precrRNA processing endoribonuclease RAMP protein Cas6 [Spirulina sp. 06S082]|uniref:CRISPR system precrRNA processing endoribonuclease RAMP protein Cas6 n=1 Tax=Spirulina sp. 06S082 TaxID=3110248 RepID=UPI002B1E9230|nr:CRISPR system precrRNA processing endoribonuclease RAMP protein Cas6 [Spirulina sp. 06S082]MEA5471205.1 CRISPR system precrRNA processing endoribonuclease RAMP protein Cas6 [Spirulina sp. 06S082]
MLISSTWQIIPDETVTLPRSYSLALGKELHQRMGLSLGTEKIPSTTFAGLLGRHDGAGDFVSLSPEETYQFSLCGLSEQSGKAIASLDLGEKLSFLGGTFRVCDRIDEKTSYEELYTTLVANDPEPVREFSLQFLTPTAFASRKLDLPLPIPASMFQSWLNRWNHFAPVYLGSDELIGYLSNSVALKKHNIITRPYQLPRGYAIGFVGDVTLHTLTRTDSLLANVAHLLVQYSRFSGTGMKTRLGMGKVCLSADRS